MSLNFVTATDAILATLNTYWGANAGAFNGGIAPKLVFEETERDLKPHPRDTTAPWARAVVRHQTSKKVTLQGTAGMARYRRTGLVWVQVFVPWSDGSAYTKAQQLAEVAQFAYEGKSAGSAVPSVAQADVIYTSAALSEKIEDGSFVRVDCKIAFYWDSVR